MLGCSRRQPIAQQLQQAGLASDVPFRNSDGDPMDLTVDNVGEISDEAFEAYVAEVYAYLQVGACLFMSAVNALPIVMRRCLSISTLDALPGLVLCRPRGRISCSYH